MHFTAVFKKVPDGSVGFVEELPGANTQAETLEEARAALAEAVQLVWTPIARCRKKALSGRT